MEYHWVPDPKGNAVELVITDAEEESGSQVSITMYLALRDRGIFRSTDGGARWSPLNDGLTVSEKISTVAAIEKTVFAGTENGLYRLDSGSGKNCHWIHQEPSVPWQSLGMIFMLE